jgi:hypothetical protein
MLSDTHPEAERVQLELIRKMTVAERIACMRQWTRVVVQLSRDGIAKANPGLDERELELLWVEHHYGRDLAVRLRDDLEKRRLCNPATS